MERRAGCNRCLQVLAAGLAWGLVPGCAGLFDTDQQQRSAQALQLDIQRKALRDLMRGVMATIELGGREIADSTREIPLKRTSVIWRMQFSGEVQALLAYERPEVAFLDFWTLAVQGIVFLRDGDGKALFGPQQEVAITTVQEVLRLAESEAPQFIPADRIEQTRQEVQDFAARHPITGAMARRSMQPSEAPSDQMKGMFSWLPSVSALNPLGGVDKGIGEGAAAIDAVGKVVDRFNDIIDFLPQRLTWRLELLQYDLAESKTVVEASKGLDRMNTSFEQVVKVARDLPGSLRQELEQTLGDLDPKLKDVRSTLVEVRSTLAEVKQASASLDKTGATFDQTAKSIEAMGRQLERGLEAFERVCVLLVGDDKEQKVPVPGDRPPPTERGRPYDILDYDQTARSIAAAAGQLNTALAGFQQLVTDGKLKAGLADVGAATEKTASSLAWTLAVAAVVTVASILLLLLGYRGIAGRRVTVQHPEPRRS